MSRSAARPAPEERVGQQIRSRHPYAYRSGIWAAVEMVVPARGRDCWLIRFPDDATDLWPCDDPVAEYEFSGPASEEISR